MWECANVMQRWEKLLREKNHNGYGKNIGSMVVLLWLKEMVWCEVQKCIFVSRSREKVQTQREIYGKNEHDVKECL